jgi:hypothetical protein
MGIILQNVGKNLLYFQNAISSGLEAASAGIQEAVTTTGISGLGSVFEAFHDSNLGVNIDPNALPVVSSVAEYPDPSQGMSKQSAPASDVLRTLQDPKFRPETVLVTLPNSLQTLIPQLKIDPQQISIVQTMNSTIKEVVQLYQQFNSSSLFTR